MKTYPIPMVPGPTSVPKKVLQAYLTDYGSADMETEFLDLYQETCGMMRTFLGTHNDVILQTGEGMIALWGALKSTLMPGDRVLAISTGVFGIGIGGMAKQVGAEVQTVEFPFNATVNDLEKIETAIKIFRPKMITVVHCETPSGTLNPIAGIGELKEKYQVPLLYMDCVASLGGAPVETDAWHVDLALGGSQKALSVPPSMSMIAISPRAWEIIHQVGYVGYDAFLPFEKPLAAPGLFPYTPNWHGVAALHTAGALLLDEGLDKVFKRHKDVSMLTQKAVQEMGLTLFYAVDAIASPTVTAVNVPEGWTWEAFDAALREKGLVV
ncbi:MAG: aminotransferase class V-fold PLP-dependent enzyme, partial [Anaerolineae bacterium]|nr:aminotransferase class V-fold PLP-dependent enzyme [Anaerolineae bacterium]